MVHGGAGNSCFFVAFTEINMDLVEKWESLNKLGLAAIKSRDAAIKRMNAAIERKDTAKEKLEAAEVQRIRDTLRQLRTAVRKTSATVTQRIAETEKLGAEIENTFFRNRRERTHRSSATKILPIRNTEKLQINDVPVGMFVKQVKQDHVYLEFSLLCQGGISEDYFRSVLTQSSKRIMYSHRSGQVVSFIVYTPTVKELYIDLVCSHRKQGGNIITNLIQIYPDATISLSAVPTAVGFYKKLGFIGDNYGNMIRRPR
jgi:hypothetical protein